MCVCVCVCVGGGGGGHVNMRGISELHTGFLFLGGGGVI